MRRRSPRRRPRFSRRSCPARGAMPRGARRPISPAASTRSWRACPPRRFPDAMSDAPTRLDVEDLHQNLQTVQEKIAQKQPIPELDRMHPADIAYFLEALPLEERQALWDLVKAREGEILLELSDGVRESLIATMDSQELVAAAGKL